jgi:hypothetical protein
MVDAADVASTRYREAPMARPLEFSADAKFKARFRQQSIWP